MTKLPGLLLSAAILGGAAVPALAQAAVAAIPRHHATRIHHVAAGHDIGAAAKSTPSTAAAKVN